MWGRVFPPEGTATAKAQKLENIAAVGNSRSQSGGHGPVARNEAEEVVRDLPGKTLCFGRVRVGSVLRKFGREAPHQVGVGGGCWGQAGGRGLGPRLQLPSPDNDQDDQKEADGTLEGAY